MPSLQKYVGKDKVTPQQMAAINKAKKLLRHRDHLKPLTEKQAKRLKGHTVGHGIRAIRLRNTSPDAKVRIGKNGMVVVSNGSDWEYHRVRPDPDSLIEAGVSLLGRKLHRPYQINLWTNAGRADEGFRDRASWAAYIRARFIQYQNAQEWIFGIAAMTRDKHKGYKNFKRDMKPIDLDDEDETDE